VKKPYDAANVSANSRTVTIYWSIGFGLLFAQSAFLKLKYPIGPVVRQAKGSRPWPEQAVRDPGLKSKERMQSVIGANNEQPGSGPNPDLGTAAQKCWA